MPTQPNLKDRTWKLEYETLHSDRADDWVGAFLTQVE